MISTIETAEFFAAVKQLIAALRGYLDTTPATIATDIVAMDRERRYRSEQGKQNS